MSYFNECLKNNWIFSLNVFLWRPFHYYYFCHKIRPIHSHPVLVFFPTPVQARHTLDTKFKGRSSSKDTSKTFSFNMCTHFLVRFFNSIFSGVSVFNETSFFFSGFLVYLFFSWFYVTLTLFWTSKLIVQFLIFLSRWFGCCFYFSFCSHIFHLFFTFSSFTFIVWVPKNYSCLAFLINPILFLEKQLIYLCYDFLCSYLVYYLVVYLLVVIVQICLYR